MQDCLNFFVMEKRVVNINLICMTSGESKNLNELRWEITNSEQRERGKNKLKMILKLLPLLVLMSLGVIFSRYSVESTLEKNVMILIYFWLIIIVAILILLFINKFILAYKKRTYYLNGLGFETSKGNKKCLYNWTDFECYYIYTAIRNDLNNMEFKGDKAMANNQRDVLIKENSDFENNNGRIYYLKKKRTRILDILYKTFVVIYSEAENDKLVKNILSSHLPQKTMTTTTDMGMVFLKYR